MKEKEIKDNTRTSGHISATSRFLTPQIGYNVYDLSSTVITVHVINKLVEGYDIENQRNSVKREKQ